MVCKQVLVGVLAAALTVTPAIAAESSAKLVASKGRVLINQGAGYQQASNGMLLNTGDSIFIGNEASATIKYVADNCEVAMPAQRVVTIETLSPCQMKAVQVEPAADLPDAQAYVPPPVVFPWPLLVAGGLVGLCVAFCGGDNDNDNDDEDPVTP